MSLTTFLARLVWVSILPLILLVVWLGITHMQDLQAEQLHQAQHAVTQARDEVDRYLQTRLDTLEILAGSPLLENNQLERFYHRAQDFQSKFDGHIILADPDLQMLLNTRVPFGTPLPRLPQPAPDAVAPQVLATGKAQVSNIVSGPVAGKPLIAIVVPVVRDGKVQQLLVSTFDFRPFQELIEDDWIAHSSTLVLQDGQGQPIAHLGPGSPVDSAKEKSARQFLAHSQVSRWSVRLEIPLAEYRAPLLHAGGALSVALLLAILAGWLGGRWAGRRLGLAVTALTQEGDAGRAACAIAETCSARQLIDAQRKQLSASEQRYRSLFENSPSAMLLIDPMDGRIVDANSAAEDFYGWPRDILKAKSIAQINTLLQAEVARQMESARKSDRNIFHFRHRVASGASRDVEVHNAPILIDDRMLLYSIIHDETARLAAERALQDALKAADRFREALEQLDAYVYMKDRESCYLYANRASLNILNVSALELIGLPPEHFFAADVAADIRASDRRVLAGERVAEEAAYLMPDGERHVFWEIKSPIHVVKDDGSQEIWGVSGISTDITAYKALQENLAYLNRRNQILLELPGLADSLDETAFMQRGLELAEDLTDSCISFLHFVNADEESIELVAWSRRTLDDYCHANCDRHYPVSQAGIWAEALRQKQAVVFNDYASAPDKRGLPAGHATLDRLISLPVIEQDKVVMLAGVGNKTSEYTARDVESLQLIANDIWRLVQRDRNQRRIARFNRMFERSLNEIYTGDALTLRFIDANRGARENSGYSLEALRTMTLLDLQPEQTPEDFARLLEPLRSGRDKKIEFTTVQRRSDGTEYAAEVSLELTEDATPVFVAIVRDISARLQMEQSLRQLAQAVEQSPESIAIADLDARIEYVNAAFVLNTGYSREELLGQNPSLLQSGKTPPASYAALWDALAQGHPWEGELFNRRKDGSEFIEWARISPIRQPDGRITHYLAIKQDITARRQAEQNLAENLAHLRELNSQLESAQNQLLQSEKMAAIGQLAAGVAHELNNPIGFVNSNLNTLDGYLKDLFAIADAYTAAEVAYGLHSPLLDHAQALKQEKDYDFLRTDIFQLMAESKDGLSRVARIVRDLKNFSHAGDAAMQWADLQAGLDSTLNIVWNELKYKCTVTKHYGDLPRVWCEHSQLNQVFMNLLVNASHAIPDKGEITITTGQQGDEVFVAIADTGSGIAPENLKRIFDPFFTTKPVGKGTGLGLSLAYGIVQKHNGRIEVQSELGKGTTFTVWLPIKSPEPDKGAVLPAPTLEQP